MNVHIFCPYDDSSFYCLNADTSQSFENDPGPLRVFSKLFFCCFREIAEINKYIETEEEWENVAQVVPKFNGKYYRGEYFP